MRAHTGSLELELSDTHLFSTPQRAVAMALLFTTHTHTPKFNIPLSFSSFPHRERAYFQQSGHDFNMAVCLWPIRGHGDWKVTQHFLEGTETDRPNELPLYTGIFIFIYIYTHTQNKNMVIY